MKPIKYFYIWYNSFNFIESYIYVYILRYYFQMLKGIKHLINVDRNYKELLKKNYN